MTTREREETNAGLCKKCGVDEKEELHSCPFQVEINGNDDPEYCDCCIECERECTLDI